MQAMTRLVVLPLLLVMTGSPSMDLEARQAPAGPPMPFVDDGACPFEGCVYRDWTANASVQVFDRHCCVYLESPKPTFTVKRGDVVTAMTGVEIFTKAGLGTIDLAHEFYVGSPEFPRESGQTISLKQGDVVYLLTYHGEGEYRAWFNGKLGTIDTAAGVQVKRGEHVWWVKIRNSAGQIGWTNQPALFDGKDAYGGR
jgi:hypothetical protein